MSDAAAYSRDRVVAASWYYGGSCASYTRYVDTTVGCSAASTRSGEYTYEDEAVAGMDEQRSVAGGM